MASNEPVPAWHIARDGIALAVFHPLRTLEQGRPLRYSARPAPQLNWGIAAQPIRFNRCRAVIFGLKLVLVLDVTGEQVDEMKPVVSHFLPLRKIRWRMAEILIHVSRFKPVAPQLGRSAPIKTVRKGRLLVFRSLRTDDPANAFHMESMEAARAKAIQGLKLVQDDRSRLPNTVKSDT